VTKEWSFYPVPYGIDLVPIAMLFKCPECGFLSGAQYEHCPICGVELDED
jgi:rubrerythrin